MSKVAIENIGDDLGAAVARIFERTIPGSDLIKSSGEVYLKPNGSDFKPYCYTDPDVVEATIRYFYDAGATQVFLMENSTQGNMTRVVFEFTGYRDICRRTGAKPIYLDEQPSEAVALPHFEDSVEFPKLVMEKFVRRRDQHTYVSLPKLKTHSMSTITLGIKNQMAFPRHADRGRHHNHELHRWLADFFAVVKPDYTLIDGVHAVFNGHYPLGTFLEDSIEKLDILIGGADTVATDTVGAKVLGYDIDEVKHLALARDDGKWRVSKVNGQPTTRPYWKDRFEVLPGGRVRELPEADALYRNDGNGHFAAIQAQPGVFLDLKVTHLQGSEAEYLTEGDVILVNNVPVFNASQSETDLTTYEVGVVLTF